jgi:hypothetical protein
VDGWGEQKIQRGVRNGAVGKEYPPRADGGCVSHLQHSLVPVFFRLQPVRVFFFVCVLSKVTVSGVPCLVGLMCVSLCVSWSYMCVLVCLWFMLRLRRHTDTPTGEGVHTGVVRKKPPVPHTQKKQSLCPNGSSHICRQLQ